MAFLVCTTVDKGYIKIKKEDQLNRPLQLSLQQMYLSSSLHKACRNLHLHVNRLTQELTMQPLLVSHMIIFRSLSFPTLASSLPSCEKATQATPKSCSDSLKAMERLA
jgi:hypothetical protein